MAIHPGAKDGIEKSGHTLVIQGDTSNNTSTALKATTIADPRKLIDKKSSKISLNNDLVNNAVISPINLKES